MPQLLTTDEFEGGLILTFLILAALIVYMLLIAMRDAYRTKKIDPDFFSKEKESSADLQSKDDNPTGV